MLSEQQYQQLLSNQQAARLPIPSIEMNPKPTKSKLNKWETEYAEGLECLHRAGDNDWWKFEGLKFRLADGAYFTPDFAVFRNGRIECHEVKGMWREAAMVRFKVACELFPGITFMAFRKKKVREGGGWERIK